MRTATVALLLLTTTAAFAAHIADALEQARNNNGASFCDFSTISASLPVKPSLRKAGTYGLSCGGRIPCFNPRSIMNFIFASP